MLVAMVLALFSRKKTGSTPSVKELPDEELMMLYAAGNVEAFEELLKRNERAVFNFIARFLGDRSAAEDLVQEVFVRVIRTAGSYKKKAKFRTWLFTITRNLCIDATRRKGRRSEVSLNRTIGSDDDGDGASFLDRLPDEETPGSASQTIRAEFRARLQTALAELPEDQREVFGMREFGGLKFREIAETLGVSENTVKSRMRYALQSLRGHLAEYRDFSFDREEALEHSAS